MAGRLIAVRLESYRGEDSSLVVNDNENGEMWILVQVPDKGMVGRVDDHGYRSRNEACEMIKIADDRAEEAARNPEE